MNQLLSQARAFPPKPNLAVLPVAKHQFLKCQSIEINYSVKSGILSVTHLKHSSWRHHHRHPKWSMLLNQNGMLLIHLGQSMQRLNRVVLL